MSIHGVKKATGQPGLQCDHKLMEQNKLPTYSLTMKDATILSFKIEGLGQLMIKATKYHI